LEFDEAGDEDELFRELPKGVHRLLSDMKRPDSPRRRERICSFQVATLRSMFGMMDCVTSSRIKVRKLLMSESGRYGVGSVMSSVVSVSCSKHKNEESIFNSKTYPVSESLPTLPRPTSTRTSVLAHCRHLRVS
jgi:hypothetical protein